jgi:hypothetical protein
MAKKLIFVSCGQLTDDEKTLGLLIKTTIDATAGFEAYFAQAAQDLEALGRHVLDAIRRCAGAVVVLHDRGVVIGAEARNGAGAPLYGSTKNSRFWHTGSSSSRKRFRFLHLSTPK